MSGAEDGRDWWMETLPIRIGRHPDNDVYLAYDTRISRHHAEIIERFGQIYLRDLGSTNGTFLIGQRLQGSMPLPLGILFRVGSTMLRLTREARGE
jgi:pSer/pThr/pTyr-binding forkhead associated (FHA) protein